MGRSERAVTAVARQLLAWLLPRRYLRLDAAAWNAQYARGRWRYLQRMDEAARYGILIGYLRVLGTDVAVLDVGCGEGILEERLGRSRYARYVGIDLSSEALRDAARRAGVGTTFVAADARTYTPDGRFDAIVFNESLYYVEEPRGLVQGYLQFLQPEGVVLVSMYDSAHTRRIWRALDDVLETESESRLANGLGVSWTIKVLRPRTPG
jgi:trans-aconitate methyltransferase